MRAGADDGERARCCASCCTRIAKCPAVTPRLKEIRSLYQLESLFPDAGGRERRPAMDFDIEFLEVALYDLHSRLDALKRAWVQYVSGEQKTAARFRELVAAFKAKATDLGNQHLIKLLDAIARGGAEAARPVSARRSSSW